MPKKDVGTHLTRQIQRYIQIQESSRNLVKVSCAESIAQTLPPLPHPLNSPLSSKHPRGRWGSVGSQLPRCVWAAGGGGAQGLSHEPLPTCLLPPSTGSRGRAPTHEPSFHPTDHTIHQYFLSICRGQAHCWTVSGQQWAGFFIIKTGNKHINAQDDFGYSTLRNDRNK